MSDISQNVYIPLPPSLLITRSIIDCCPECPQCDYYNGIISDTEKQINNLYYVKNVGQTNIK